MVALQPQTTHPDPPKKGILASFQGSCAFLETEPSGDGTGEEPLESSVAAAPLNDSPPGLSSLCLRSPLEPEGPAVGFVLGGSLGSAVGSGGDPARPAQATKGEWKRSLRLQSSPTGFLEAEKGAGTGPRRGGGWRLGFLQGGRGLAG